MREKAASCAVNFASKMTENDKVNGIWIFVVVNLVVSEKFVNFTVVDVRICHFNRPTHKQK